MTRVIFDISMSLDGFVTAPNVRPEEPLGDGGQRLHEWAFGDDERNRELLAEAVRAVGAVIAGRRTYDLSVPWWEADGPTGPARVPVFVVSNSEPEEVPERGVYTFVTDGIESALEQAMVAAGGTSTGAGGVLQRLKRHGLCGPAGRHRHVSRVRANPTNRRRKMLLEGKNAIIYGGGGAIGGAGDRALAGEGATVFLAGRTLERLEEVAGQIRAAGGVAETSRVDALDQRAIEEHVGEVVERVRGVDISFNAISIRDVQLIPLAEMSREDFMSPIVTGTASHFLTARAAARRMAERDSGVIMTLSASAVRAYVTGVYVGGFGIACAAIEALTKQLAAELGPRGIRVNCLRLEGIPESWEGVSTEDWSAPPPEIEAQLKTRSLLGRVTTLADVGNAAAFLASDLAGATTGTVFNLTSGTVVD